MEPPHPCRALLLWPGGAAGEYGTSYMGREARVADTAAVRAELQERLQTDRLVPPWLGFLPAVAGLAVLVLMGLFVAVGEAAGGEAGGSAAMVVVFPLFMAAYLGAFAVVVWVAYVLMWRRDAHFRRILYLKQDAEAYLAARARETGADVNHALYRLRALERPVREQAEPRGAVTWAVLSLAGPGVFGLAYLLMADFRLHEAAEMELVSALEEGLTAVGQGTSLAFAPQVPERSFWLYVVLAVVTSGLFALYWFWVLAADPNQHFAEHESWEARLGQVIV
jgi:hypothetical protein